MAFQALTREGIKPVGFQCPMQYDYGYFGCWYSRTLFFSMLDPQMESQVPSFLVPRMPHKAAPLDTVTMDGLPELRRASGPFECMEESDAQAATGKPKASGTKTRKGIDIPGVKIDIGRRFPGRDQGNPAVDNPLPPATLEDFNKAHGMLLGRYGEEGSVSVEGVVSDEQGRPIRGATVGFGPYGLLPFQCNRETDEAGKFRVGWVPKSPGDSSDSIVACADGYAATRMPFAKPPGNYTLSIRLKPGKVFRGRVFDEEGNPVRNAFAVVVAKVPEEPKWTVQYRADSDAEGRFKWTGVCAEDVAVYIGKPGPIDKIGYHAQVMTGRADGKEQTMKLKRLPGEDESFPQPRIYEVLACFVEPPRLRRPVSTLRAFPEVRHRRGGSIPAPIRVRVLRMLVYP